MICCRTEGRKFRYAAIEKGWRTKTPGDRHAVYSLVDLASTGQALKWLVAMGSPIRCPKNRLDKIAPVSIIDSGLP